MPEKAKKTPSPPKKKSVTTKAAEKTTKVADTKVEGEIENLRDEKRISELETKLDALEKKEAIVAEKTPRPVQTVYTSNGGGTAKFLAALFAILFIGAAASAVYFYNESNLNADCETNYKGLLSDYTEVSTLYGVLSSEKVSLEEQVTTLTSQKASLSAELDELENSNADKDVEISTLEAQIAELDEDIDDKEGRITYLEIMLDSCRERNEQLEEGLATCQDGMTEINNIELHPYINTYWTSNPDTNPAELEFVEGEPMIKFYYIYLCMSCTDCYTDPCDVCDPCDTCCETTCCTSAGSQDSIRLKVRVTTEYDEVEEVFNQSIEIVSWTWV